MALIALMSLSIPRRIVVSDEMVEIRCLLDITEIRRDEIASVRRVDARRMQWFVPIFGGCGFFGYYGHFIDLRRFDRVRLYASEWRNFVEITDIYEDRLYVSCADADRLVADSPAGRQPPRRRGGRRGKRQLICRNTTIHGCFCRTGNRRWFLSSTKIAIKVIIELFAVK